MMPLAGCLAACLAEPKCDAVAVEWAQLHAWPAPALGGALVLFLFFYNSDKVRCGLCGGIDRDATATHLTITIVGGALPQ